MTEELRKLVLLASSAVDLLRAFERCPEAQEVADELQDALKPYLSGPVFPLTREPSMAFAMIADMFAFTMSHEDVVLMVRALGYAAGAATALGDTEMAVEWTAMADRISNAQEKQEKREPRA
jgi:hypothetical protein